MVAKFQKSRWRGQGSFCRTRRRSSTSDTLRHTQMWKDLLRSVVEFWQTQTPFCIDHSPASATFLLLIWCLSSFTFLNEFKTLKKKSLKKEQTKCSNLFVTSFLVDDPTIPNETLIKLFLGVKLVFTQRLVAWCDRACTNATWVYLMMENYKKTTLRPFLSFTVVAGFNVSVDKIKLVLVMRKLKRNA